MRESHRTILKDNLLAYVAATSPSISDPSKAREWSEKVSKTWSHYTSLEMGLEYSDKKPADVTMMELYEHHVKNLKPQLSKNTTGELMISGLGTLLDSHNRPIKQ